MHLIQGTKSNLAVVLTMFKGRMATQRCLKIPYPYVSDMIINSPIKRSDGLPYIKVSAYTGEQVHDTQSSTVHKMFKNKLRTIG